MNYETDIRIDPDSLDVEWLNQPTLVMKYSREVAQLKRELELAKERLDLTKAEIDKDVRTHPDKYKLDKVTEKAIDSITLDDPEFKKDNKTLIDTRYDLDIAQAALNAISQRKDALENLVRLHGMQYFAGPKVPRELSKEWEKKQTQQNVNKEVKQSMTRSK